MPSTRVSTTIPVRSGKGSSPQSLSLEHLAHELNSLLDGSLRSLALARDALESETSVSIAARLETAHQALRAMSDLLERAMQKPESGLDILGSHRLLGDEIKAALEALKPFAQENDIIFTLNFSENSPDPVSGLLAPVIANGLRNAVEAIAIRPQQGGRVDISVNLEQDNLHIRISDNGVGLNSGKHSGDTTPTPPSPPASHGIGLELCRNIITSLGGKLSLTNKPDTEGAQLIIEVPLRSLDNA